jgi:hypothetical protein
VRYTSLAATLVAASLVASNALAASPAYNGRPCFSWTPQDACAQQSIPSIPDANNVPQPISGANPLPVNVVSGGGTGGGGNTATGATSSTYTASGTANTPTQVVAADSARKDAAIVYPASATGVLTIYENAGTAPSYQLQPGQTYRATQSGLVYQGVIYAASTVASDTAYVTVYK